MQRWAGEALMNLVAKNLASCRGGRPLFAGISFVLGAGEALLLLGPNGSGKTTLIRTIAGLMTPAAGSIRIDGGDPERSVGEQCHYVGHRNALKGSLTVAENAAFSVAGWMGSTPPWRLSGSPACATFPLATCLPGRSGG